MQPTYPPNDLSQWIGRTETLHDQLHVGPANLMELTLDRAATLKIGDALPPLWHWLYFLRSATLSGLGRDGHPAKGGFLPPVDLPRRMWAGGRFGFHHDLYLGSEVTKTSEILRVTPKTGRTGDLCFVTVRHEIGIAAQTSAFWEEHDIVYREDPAAGSPARPAPPLEGEWTHRETVTPSEVMLFRYSALTFNGHRIHYDRDYARNVEGHAGLVVHGPLIATLLLDMAMRLCAGARLSAFSFRAASPLFDTAPFVLLARRTGNTIELAASTPEGGLAMQASAVFTPETSA